MDISFELYDGNTNDLIERGYQFIKCHMIFDIKMGEKVCRKAHIVVDSHMTEAPSSMTYSLVVSKDSIRIALMATTLNDLSILACNIQNAYLAVLYREKI